MHHSTMQSTLDSCLMRWVAFWVTLDTICPAFLLGEEAFLRLHATVAGLAFVTSSFEVAKRDIDFVLICQGRVRCSSSTCHGGNKAVVAISIWVYAQSSNIIPRPSTNRDRGACMRSRVVGRAQATPPHRYSRLRTTSTLNHSSLRAVLMSDGSLGGSYRPVTLPLPTPCKLLFLKKLLTIFCFDMP
jgi:hypothetical protein